jgi:outer membrane receptor protein involved in Fe transport
MLARYVDSVDEDIPDGTVGFFKAVIVLVANTETASARADGKIDSMVTVDLQYNYNFGERAFLSDSNVTVGLQNVFDEKPPVVSYVTAYDPTLHDGRGRLFFFKVSGSL